MVATSTFSAAPADDRPANRVFQIGSQISRYVIVGELGAGGMGRVYRAYDPDLDRAVAIKILHPRANRLDHLRLVREAQAIARVNHPNVVSVYDVGVDDRLVFVAMQLISGVTLKEWLRHKPTQAEVLAIFEQAGSALAAAHATGIIHRDFKPSNVMIDREGVARVVDFGLALAISEEGTTLREVRAALAHGAGELDERITETGCTLGTRGYIAPELFGGGEADARTDQYSFSVSLFQALTGGLPAAGARSASESLHRAHVPRWLVELVVRGLDPAPEQRYPDMQALLDDLRRYRRKPRWHAAVLGAGMITVAFLSLLLFGSREHDSFCESAGTELSASWNPATRENIRAAFARLDLPVAQDAWVRVENVLDGYATTWSKKRRLACENRKDTSELVETTAHWRCLDRRRDEFVELVTILADADREVLARAVQSANQLLPLSLCDRVVGARDNQSLGEHEAVLARVGALLDFGRLEEARVLLEPLYAQARASNNALFLSRVLMLKGRLSAAREQFDEATRAFEDAAAAADEAGADAVRLRAYASLMSLDAGTWADAKRFNDYERAAQTVLARTGEDPLGQMELLSARATRAFARHEFRSGVELAKQAQRLQNQWLPPGHRDHIQTRLLLGKFHGQLGDWNAAWAEAAQAEELARQTLGNTHPELAHIWIFQSRVQRFRGDSLQAEQLARQALEMLENFYQPRDGRIIAARTALADALYEQHRLSEVVELHKGSLELERGRPPGEVSQIGQVLMRLALAMAVSGDGKGAEPYARRAVALFEGSHGSEHPAYAIALNMLGATLRHQKRWAESLETYRRTLAIFRHHDPEHPEQVQSVRHIAQSLIALERSREGLTELERTLVLTRKIVLAPRFVGDVEFYTAHALHDAGGDPERVLALARSAAARYREAEQEQDLREIRTWFRREFPGQRLE